MTFKETITTFIIMILIVLMTIAFNYEPSHSIELQKDAERLELELKKEAIREKINLQYN